MLVLPATYMLVLPTFIIVLLIIIMLLLPITIAIV